MIRAVINQGGGVFRIVYVWGGFLNCARLQFSFRCKDLPDFFQHHAQFHVIFGNFPVFPQISQPLRIEQKLVENQCEIFISGGGCQKCTFDDKGGGGQKS